MHRIDTPTAQEGKFGAGKNGFTDGDTALGTRATQLNANFFDAVQEELAGVIEGFGGSLSKSDHGQLFSILSAEIKKLLSKDDNLVGVVDKAAALANLGGVPETRKVNGHALTSDVTLSASDVRALSVDGGIVNGDLTVSGAQTFTSSASAPTTLTGASPCILFSETDTGKKYYLVEDGSNIRLNEDSTAGTLVWSWDAKNKTFQTGGTFAGSLSGKATTATTLATARTVQTNLGSTSAASFNGSANITPGVTGTLPIANGGTGSTTAAGARSALGCGTAATMSYSTAAYTQLSGSPTEAASTKQLVGLRDAVYTKTAGDSRYQLKNTASKAASGWFKDTTTGIITQWQKIQTTTANDNSFTFPIAFPNANLGCVGTVMDQSNPDAGVRTVKIASRTKTGFNCTTVNGSGHMACPVFVYSVGY